MIKLDESQLQESSRDILLAVRDLEAGTGNFVDNVRRVKELGTVVSVLDHDPDFMIFVAVDSESDHLPGSAQRQHCSQEWLDQCDKEATELEAKWIEQVRDACSVLLKRFGS